jgi:hypothetical protein
MRRRLDQLENEKSAYKDEQQEILFEQWWNDPATMFEKKLLHRPQRALQEEMQKPDSFLLNGCRIYEGHWYDLSRAAATLSLGYQAVSGPIDLPPDVEIDNVRSSVRPK